MCTLSLFAPAKLNLFLAVTGRRTDGFHDLVSVVALVDFGDTLHVETKPGGHGDGRFELNCDDPAVPVNESNLVIKAARAFVAASGWSGCAKFFLEKRIPLGAGLGGGSSDAVATLRALNQISGGLLAESRVAEVAGALGSDCSLFLARAPVVMRGRGERIEIVPATTAIRLRGRRVLIFKPAFGIATPWAFGRMAAAPANYVSAAEAEAMLASWVNRQEAPAEQLLFNNMEGVAFAKFVALPSLLKRLKDRFGVSVLMSGSGSACFILLAEDSPVVAITAGIREAWGESAFVMETRIAEIPR